MRTLPQPQQLAALGAVLCQFRPRAGGELGGWAQAVRADACTRVDSDGVHERLVFMDAAGEVCWQLHLLPDTDFLAWERLGASLPAHRGSGSTGGIAQRLWRRFAERDAWQLDALRLHMLPGAPGFAALRVLAASPAPLSPLGAEVARRIARRQGIDAGAVIDDCCCRAAARAARLERDLPAAEIPYPFIRFDRSEPA